MPDMTLKGKGKTVKEYVYSPGIQVYRFSGLYIDYPQLLELTLSQSHLPGENSAQYSAAVAIHKFSLHLVPITIGQKEVVWILSLPKAFTYDHRCGNRTPDPVISGPTP